MSGLCGGSQPPVGHPTGERTEKQSVGQGREGEEGRKEKKAEIRERRGRRREERTDGSIQCKGDALNSHVSMLARGREVGPAISDGWKFFGCFELF